MSFKNKHKDFQGPIDMAGKNIKQDTLLRADEIQRFIKQTAWFFQNKPDFVSLITIGTAKVANSQSVLWSARSQIPFVPD